MAVSDAVVQNLFTGIDLTGVLANATLGGVIARAARLDPVGFATLAILSGLGGGLIRDTLLQHGTPVALTDPAYIPTALAGAMIAFFLRVEGRLWKYAFPFVDALALGCWAATGAQKTLTDGLAWLPAVLLGTITAVGGGMTRDIFLRRIPQIFGGNTLYATSAVLASGVMVVFYELGDAPLGLILATLTGAGLTLLARWRGWGLPEAHVWQPPQAWHAARLRRARGDEKHQQSASELKGVAMDASSPERVLAGLDQVRSWQQDFYRDLHRNPELSHQERRTAGRAAEWLRRGGYEVHEGVGGTGVVGVLRNGAGPTVLLRADMDALPVREATGLPYASTVTVTDADGNQVPVMHACGHDVHVSCLVGAAELLAGGRDAWHGTVVALFQPAEEVADGARGMVDDKLGDLIPAPDVALAQHVLPFPAGLVGTRPGPVLSAADSIRITIHGRGAHGSMPQAAVDPVVLAAAIVTRLQTIVSRELQPGEYAVLTVGSVQAGTKANVIPDSAQLLLNMRTYSEATRSAMLAAIRRIVTAECQASGSPQDPEFELYERYPLTANDDATTTRVADAFAAYFGDRAQQLPQQSASEDFSDIPRALGVPYTYWGIGGIDPGTYRKAEQAGRVQQDIPVNHSPNFAPVIQPTLDTGTQALITAALAWL
jgi:hippurate hydrolase